MKARRNLAALVAASTAITMGATMAWADEVNMDSEAVAQDSTEAEPAGTPVVTAETDTLTLPGEGMVKADRAEVTAQPGNNLVYLTWNPVVGSSQYRVKVYNGDTLVKTMPSASGYYTGTKATIAGLTNGVEYTFAVAADIGAELVDLPEVSATPAALPPMPTRAPALVASTFDSLTVSLTAVSSVGGVDEVSGYQIRLAPLTEPGAVTVVDVPADNLKPVIAGLETNVAYMVDYAAMAGKKVGAFSDAKLVATPTGAPAPKDVSVARVGNRTVYLDWANDPNVPRYNVYYRPADGSAPEKAMSSVGSAAAVKALDNGTEYIFTVAAVVPAGSTTKVGNRSGEVRATPVTADIPTDVRVVTAGNTKAWLDWTPVDGAEAYYIKATAQTRTEADYIKAMENIADLYDAEADAMGIKLTTNKDGQDTYYIYAWDGRGLSNPPEERELTVAGMHEDLAAKVVAMEEFSNVYILKSKGYWPTEDTKILPKNHDALIAEATDGGVCWVDLDAKRTDPSEAPAYCEGLNIVTPGPNPAPVKIMPNATDAAKAIGKLTNGVEYLFQVATMLDSQVGDYSPESNSPMATPMAVPGAVNLGKVSVGEDFITVKWATPAAVEGVQGADRFRITATPADGSKPIVAEVGDVRTYTFDGLASGVVYSLRLESGNDMGYGPYSSALNLIPNAKPAAVTGASAVRSNEGTAVTLEWDRSDRAKSYTIAAKPADASAPAVKSATTVADTITFSGLEAGSAYTFTITAVNDAGNAAGSKVEVE